VMTSPNGAAAKKDLHVGGVGASGPGVLAAVIDPLVEASDDWVRKARDLVSTTDDYVRNNPWQALAIMAMLGVTLGYLVARSARAPSRGLDLEGLE
jgi:ElaB/YqjD/DUF883 family membrane-anchored ribosome-binding protein